MSGEFMSIHSFDRFKEAGEWLDDAVERAGGTEAYLLALQVEQARTGDGRAELIRLQRVSSYIASPGAEQETPQSRAFYHGALISSALLQEVTPDKAFTGGTHALHYYMKHFNRQAEDKGARMTGIQGMGFREELGRTLASYTYEWPEDHTGHNTPAGSQKSAMIERLFAIADRHVYKLYSDEEDLYHEASTGFWLPLQEVLTAATPDQSAFELNQVNISTKHVPEYADPAAITHDTIDTPEFYPIHDIQRAIIKAFKAARKHFNKEGDYTEAEKIEINTMLETLNRNQSLFDTDDLIQVEGLYFMATKDGEDPLQIGRITSDTTVRGRFIELTTIEVPSEQMLKMTNHPANRQNQDTPLKLILAPALVLQDPVIMQRSEDGELCAPLEDTTMTIPLIYSTADISRLM